MNILEPLDHGTWTPALRELPSLFDGDDAALGLVDRSGWAVSTTINLSKESDHG